MSGARKALRPKLPSRSLSIRFFRAGFFCNCLSFWLGKISHGSWHSLCFGPARHCMNTATVSQPKANRLHNETVIHLPLGLLGFESVKKYQLIARPEEEPFLWLQMLDNPNHAFLVISPSFVVPNYQPDLSDEDVQFLGLASSTDALVLAIVTFRAAGQLTVNLKGPIVVNRQSLVGKQVIPSNANQFALQHPIPVPA